MVYKIERSKDSDRLTLEGELTIATAGELRDALVDGLESSAHLVVDLSGVTGVDLTALQLLFSTVVTAEKRGKRVNISGAPDSFHEMVIEAGYAANKGCRLGEVL